VAWKLKMNESVAAAESPTVTVYDVLDIEDTGVPDRITLAPEILTVIPVPESVGDTLITE
jgi:hypothetical protein